MQQKNIVKQTCEALNIKQTELGKLMGVDPGTPAQWSSKGNIPLTAKKFMQLLIDHHNDKAQLEKLKSAVQAFKEIA